MKYTAFQKMPTFIFGSNFCEYWLIFFFSTTDSNENPLSSYDRNFLLTLTLLLHHLVNLKIQTNRPAIADIPNTHSLEYRRIYSDLVLCFQLLSNGFNSQLVNTFIKSTDNRTRGHSLKLIKQSCSVDATKYYFTNRVVNIWNSLPSHIVSSPTLSTFKLQLQKHDFTSHLIVYTV